MTLPELDRALRQLRLSGMADVLDARLRCGRRSIVITKIGPS